MYLSGLNEPVLMIKPDSDLDNVNPEYLEKQYTVRLTWSDYTETFIKKFLSRFKNVENVDLGNYLGDVEPSFIYELPKLEGLVISLFRDSNFILDCAKLPKSLYSLNLSVWSKKHIVNIEALNNTDLKVLYISEFDEKDLTKLSTLTNLTGLGITRSKIKSLKGIETLTNLDWLSLGAVRSLTDLSDITTLQKLEELEINVCWKLEDFSPIGSLQKLKRLRLIDCKKLASIQFVRDMPNLKYLSTMGSTVINDYDTTPAEHVPVFFGSIDKRYNKQYPEKEIHKKLEDL